MFVPAILRQSKILMLEGKTKHAMSLAISATKIEQGNSQAWLLCSTLQAFMRQTEEAWISLNSCVKEDSLIPKNCFDKGISYLGIEETVSSGGNKVLSVDAVNLLEDKKLMQMGFSSDLMKHSRKVWSEMGRIHKKMWLTLSLILKHTGAHKFVEDFRRIFGHSFRNKLIAKIMNTSSGSFPYDVQKKYTGEDEGDTGFFLPQRLCEKCY